MIEGLTFNLGSGTYAYYCDPVRDFKPFFAASGPVGAYHISGPGVDVTVHGRQLTTDQLKAVTKAVLLCEELQRGANYDAIDLNPPELDELFRSNTNIFSIQVNPLVLV